ncbi:MAG: hypothetical protein AB1608_00425 [Thermoproteota archaeon]
MSLSQPRTKANSCLFCGETLKTPSKCPYCGFKFCEEHKPTENHQCGKTRYAEYVRKPDANKIPNLASGMFIVVCDICGYKSAKASLIEFAGEELIQHMQIVGCKDNTFLEEVDSSSPFNSKTIHLKQDGSQTVAQTENSNSQESVVEQLAKLADLKEKGALSEEEFVFIKKEIIKRLK